MKTTLVIMAAGMASRYGGNKQTDAIGPHGERLMEYSICDAVRAGFRKVVLIIKPEARELMDGMIGEKLRAFRLPDGEGIELDYAYQDFSTVPSFYTIPRERVKPFGTGHALLCARAAVQEPFCVINADDYYGPDAYRVMREALVQLPLEGRAAMVGYILKNTLSLGGTVSRGICDVENGVLRGVTERLTIGAAEDGSLKDFQTDTPLSPGDIVSMNLWGFAPSFFDALDRAFTDFLRRKAGDNPKAECQLPVVVNGEMEAGRLSVSVLRSDAVWFGMTYREDRDHVAAELRRLHDQGVYPASLWE
ncbi:MAG: hypothetical protein IJT94_14400 [Oscillibacter sp.]|nr:hypothetical protein [Oscillibacter sp.]